MPAFIKNIDPKLIAAAVTYLLTLLITRVGLELTDPLIPGYLTVAQAIALAAAAVVGYITANDGTVLRTEQEDGNPDPDVVKENLGTEAGYGLVEMLIAAILLIVFLYVVVAVVD